MKQGQATASPVEGEKNTKDAESNLKDELVDLLGTNVMIQYYNKKLLFDKYCDKMLKRKKIPKITNCKVLTKKGPITLKIYREDGSEEVISNLKVSDIHLVEWREVIQACPDKSEKGWKTIYDLVKTRLNQVLRRLGSIFTSGYTAYYNKKLLFDKYCDKMLKRKKIPKITNCKVLTKKGPITLKIYREDGSEEVISNLKVSDIHLVEWREVIQACPDKSEKGWKTIYDLVKTRLNQVLRRLGSIFTSGYTAVQNLKKDSWKELHFSLVDNSKLNVVYLLNRS
nr:hypothetical protein [Tanacetum cinerariifolium]